MYNGCSSKFVVRSCQTSALKIEFSAIQQYPEKTQRRNMAYKENGAMPRTYSRDPLSDGTPAMRHTISSWQNVLHVRSRGPTGTSTPA